MIFYKIGRFFRKQRKSRGEVQLYLGHLTHGHIFGGTEFMITGTSKDWESTNESRIAWHGKKMDLNGIYYKGCEASKLPVARILESWGEYKGLVIMISKEVSEFKHLFYEDTK
jgi:hypothetical protein